MIINESYMSQLLRLCSYNFIICILSNLLIAYYFYNFLFYDDLYHDIIFLFLLNYKGYNYFYSYDKRKFLVIFLIKFNSYNIRVREFEWRRRKQRRTAKSYCRWFMNMYSYPKELAVDIVLFREWIRKEEKK